MFRNLKLRNKLLLSYGAIILFIVLVISLINFKITSEALEKDLRTYSDEYLIQLSHNLDNRIEALNDKSFSRFLSLDLFDNRNYQKYLTNNHEKNPLVDVQFRKIVSDILVTSIYFKAIVLVDLDGNVYTQSKDKEDNGILKMKDFVKQDIKQYTTMKYIDAQLFCLLKPMYDISTTELIGYSAISIDKRFFTDQFWKSEKSKDWSVVLLDEDFNLLVSEENNSLEIYHDEFRNEVKKNYLQYTFEHEGEKYVVNIVKSQKYEINVINIIPVKIIKQSSAELVKFILIACFMAALVSFVVAIGISSTISKNVKILILNIRRMTQGHFNTKIEIESTDEIGQIGIEFNLMAVEINHLINEVYKENLLKEVAQKKAMQFEYDALQEKMNPHFLYNILESINSMAKIDGNENISEVVCLLGELLRETIGNDQSIIYLEDELEYVRKYLEIKRLMRKNTIQYIYDVDEELLGARVPKFIMQPIIENAIVHGISENAQIGLITIKCHLIDSNLFIEIIDNGKGFDKNNLQLSEQNTQVGERWRRTKIGINSVDKRIKILYGDAYGVKITSEPMKGTSVHIVMPYMTNSKEVDQNDEV